MLNSLKQRLFHLLRQSERYTKTDMVYFSRNGMYLFSAALVSGFLAFATSVAFANLLPKVVYGSYQYVLSIVALVSIVALPGMKTAVSYASARGADKSLFSIATLKLRWGAGAGAVLGACALYYFSEGNTVLGSGFLVTAIFVPFWEAPGLYVPYLQGKKRFDLLKTYENSIQAALTLAVVTCLFFTDNLALLLLSYFATLTLTRTFFFMRTLRHEPPQGGADPGATSYGKHLTVMAAVGAVASNVDKFLLWHLTGPAALAGYVFALAIPQRAVGMVRIVEQLAFPKMARQKFSDIRKTLLRKIILLVIPATAMAVLYIFLAPFIFRIFFSQYLDALPYSQLAAVLIALQPFALIATTFGAHARTQELYALAVAPPVLQVMLFIFLVPSFGLLGAVSTLLIVQVCESILLLWLLLKKSEEHAGEESTVSSQQSR